MRFRQQIPRPSGAEIVDTEATFARLGRDDAIALGRWPVVERAFLGDGDGAQPSAVPAGAPDRVAAAVLLPLLPAGATGGGSEDAGGRIDLALIRRATHLRANPGEVAFPGGRLEPGESALEAAVREAHEEVALPPESVRVLGALPPVSRASRPEPIAAFVAAVGEEAREVLSANPAEVDELLLTPLSDLLDPARYWEESWSREGQTWRMSFFDLGDDLVWGASARILVSLFERLAASK